MRLTDEVERLRTVVECGVLSPVLSHTARGHRKTQPVSFSRNSGRDGASPGLSMPVRHKIPRLDCLARNVISRLLLGALSGAPGDSDLSETEEICQVLACLDVLEIIAGDILDKLAEVLYFKKNHKKLTFFLWLEAA